MRHRVPSESPLVPEIRQEEGWRRFRVIRAIDSSQRLILRPVTMRGYCLFVEKTRHDNRSVRGMALWLPPVSFSRRLIPLTCYSPRSPRLFSIQSRRFVERRVSFHGVRLPFFSNVFPSLHLSSFSLRYACFFCTRGSNDLTRCISLVWISLERVTRISLRLFPAFFYFHPPFFSVRLYRWPT